MIETQVPSSGILNYVLGAGGLGGILWAIYERIARMKVERSEASSSVAENTANETLFNMLTKRLTDLEEEVKRLRRDLDREREYTHTLVTEMIKAGLKPPPYTKNEQ